MVILVDPIHIFNNVGVFLWRHITDIKDTKTTPLMRVYFCGFAVALFLVSAAFELTLAF